jgi:hypothetical protein
MKTENENRIAIYLLILLSFNTKESVKQSMWVRRAYLGSSPICPSHSDWLLI